MSTPFNQIVDVIQARPQDTATTAIAGAHALQNVAGVWTSVDDQSVATQLRTVVAGEGALLSKVHAGRNLAGAVTLTGAVVGMKVRQVLTVTAGALVDSSALFETTITVANQIQQSSATDLSAVIYSFLLQS